MNGQTPTPEDLSRDLDADLALVEKATKGPWIYNSLKLRIENEDGDRKDLWWRHPWDDAYTAASRTGWPAAIRRAKAAEEALAEARKRIEELEAKLTGEKEDNASLRRRVNPSRPWMA